MTSLVPLPHFRSTRRCRGAGAVVLALLAITLPASSETARRSPSTAPSEGRILYSARYYAPPRSHLRSHFHLYTVRADGSGRRQLTHGDWDDIQPQFSPGAARVAFVRDTNYEMGGRSSIWILDLRSGTTRKLEELAANDFPDTPGWTADGKTIVVRHRSFRNDDHEEHWIDRIDAETGRAQRRAGEAEHLESPRGDRVLISDEKGARIVDAHGAAVAMLPSALDHARWLSSTTLVGIRGGETDLAILWFDRDGKRLQEQQLHEKDLQGRVDDVLPGPDHGSVLLAVDRSNSTVRPAYEFVRVDSSTGKTRSFMSGQFFAWSPGKDRFCTAPPRDLSTYEKLPGGRERSVWVAPLQVGSATDGKPHSITPGLVWVVAAQWTH